MSELKEHVFTEAADAITAIRHYEQSLTRIAYQRRLRNQQLSDQDQPVEVFALRPAILTSRPLVLLGGMGPLAGAQGFAQACLSHPQGKEIVLFQACSTPNRSIAIESIIKGRDCAAQNRAEIIESLSLSTKQAVTYVQSNERMIDLIVLCNASHYFLDEILERLSNRHSDIGSCLLFISLIRSTTAAIQVKGFRRIMALYTEGTKQGRIYSLPLEELGITCIEREDLQPVLTAAIYDGVKAFDDELTIRLGTHLFQELLKSEQEFDCILTGCTEVPVIIEKLQRYGNEDIKSFLSRVAVLDPVTAALAST
jgi:aspartate/glutamate racemase